MLGRVDDCAAGVGVVDMDAVLYDAFKAAQGIQVFGAKVRR